jgi:hypothetical protein
MTNRTAFFVGAVLLFGVFVPFTGLNAQTNSHLWRIESYPAGEAVVSDVLEMESDGWLPVGMEVTVQDETTDSTADATVEVLYILSDTFPFSRARFEHFEGLNTAIEETSTLISEGWVPVDISIAGDTLYVLLIETPLEIQTWDMRVTILVDAAMTATVMELTEEGYSIWGISGAEDGSVWILAFAEPDREAPRSVNLDFFDVDTLAEDVGNTIAEGWIPWGLMRGPSNLYMLFTQ